MIKRIANEAIRQRAAALLIAVADYLGTFLFGMEGALAAINGHLDVFGAMVLSFCTALGGGIIRDLLIGAVPPGSISDWRYGALAFAGGGTAILLYQLVQRVPPLLMTALDAGGLSLFAVAGAAKALNFRINPFIAILMGTITGVGGGTIRDILLARVPTVLNADVYATAAMLGAALYVAGTRVKVWQSAAAMVGGLACFTLRMVAVSLHWSLPELHPP